MKVWWITICLTTIWKLCLVNGRHLKPNNGHPIFGHFQLILQSFCPNSGDFFAFDGLNLFEGLWTVRINIVFRIFLQESVWRRQNWEDVFRDESTKFFFDKCLNLCTKLHVASSFRAQWCSMTLSWTSEAKKLRIKARKPNPPTVSVVMTSSSKKNEGTTLSAKTLHPIDFFRDYKCPSRNIWVFCELQ